MSAVGAQRFDPSKFVHPRGFSISSVFTCPQCSALIVASRVNLRHGVQRCGHCGMLWKVGLSLFALPTGPNWSRRIAPDETLPGKERSLKAMRQRVRAQRIEYLRSVGLDDPMPHIAFTGYHGQCVNSVTVVQDVSEAASPIEPGDPEQR